MRVLNQSEIQAVMGGTLLQKIVVSGLCSFIIWGVNELNPKATPLVAGLIGAGAGIYGSTLIFGPPDERTEMTLYAPGAYAGFVIGWTLGSL